MGRAHGIKQVGAIPTSLLAVVAAACIATALISISLFRSPIVATARAPDRSFLSSLDRFLERGLNSRAGLSLQWTGNAEDLDRAMEERARERSSSRVLQVYVYDMPEKFTLDLLRLFRDTYQKTTNLTSNGSPVHRLIEQHSVDYWLYADLLSPEPERLLKSVKRVMDPATADFFFIPFFSTISYFLSEQREYKQLYREALSWITSQAAWKRSGGRDHVLPVHHPWSFKTVRRFMKTAIWLLPDLDATGNWYKPGEVSLEKDVVLPYVPNVAVCDAQCLEASWNQRHTLLFFRGRRKRNAGGKIRNKLASVLENEPNVVFEEGSIGESGRQATQDGMHSSIFCLHPAGDTPSSARLFDAVVSGCIPVIVSDELEPPFEGILDYRKVALFVPSIKAIEKGWLVSYLRDIPHQQVSTMQSHMLEFSKHFQYSSPSQPLGPEDLTWQTIAGKLQSISVHVRRMQRSVEGSRNICACSCRVNNSSRSSYFHTEL